MSDDPDVAVATLALLAPAPSTLGLPPPHIVTQIEPFNMQVRVAFGLMLDSMKDCGCKDEKIWCRTNRCACYKAQVKCSQACHGGKKKDSLDRPDCPNISDLATRTQKGLKDLDKEDDGAGGSKRQRRSVNGRFSRK